MSPVVREVWAPRNYEVRGLFCRGCQIFLADEVFAVQDDYNWNYIFAALDLHNVLLNENRNLVCRCGTIIGGPTADALMGNQYLEVRENFFSQRIGVNNGGIRAIIPQFTEFPTHGFYACHTCHRTLVACHESPTFHFDGMNFNPLDVANVSLRRGCTIRGGPQRYLICECSAIVGEMFDTLNCVLFTQSLMHITSMRDADHILIGIEYLAQEQPMLQIFENEANLEVPMEDVWDDEENWEDNWDSDTDSGIDIPLNINVNELIRPVHGVQPIQD